MENLNQNETTSQTQSAQILKALKMITVPSGKRVAQYWLEA